MKPNSKLYKIIMVGPALEGLGGISRVAKIWQESSFFSDFNVIYFASVTDAPANRFFFLIKGLVDYTVALITGCLFVYIHTSSYNSFRRKSLFICIALIFRAKILLHIHPSHFYQFLSGVVGLEKRFVFFLFRRIHGFVVLTEEMEKNIKGLFPHKLVSVLRNPINLEKMKNIKGHERMRNSLLYLGWYIKAKGVYDLVDAIEILTQKGIKIHLDFYGTKQLDELENYVRNKQLIEQICINGWLSDANKLEALYKCTMLILPSHSEGIPNVILEAMATKTPIIATPVGGLKEILRDGENAIIAQANNPRDLSEKILKCFENKALRNKITANAYQEATTKYDVRVIKEEFARIIETILV